MQRERENTPPEKRAAFNRAHDVIFDSEKANKENLIDDFEKMTNAGKKLSPRDQWDEFYQRPEVKISARNKMQAAKQKLQSARTTPIITPEKTKDF